MGPISFELVLQRGAISQCPNFSRGVGSSWHCACLLLGQCPPSPPPHWNDWKAWHADHLLGPEHTGHFVQPHVAAHCGGPEHTRATCGGDMHVMYANALSVAGDEPQPVAHLNHKLQCARQSLKIMVSYGNKYPRHNARPHVAKQSGQCARALKHNENSMRASGVGCLHCILL